MPRSFDLAFSSPSQMPHFLPSRSFHFGESVRWLFNSFDFSLAENFNCSKPYWGLANCASPPFLGLILLLILLLLYFCLWS